MFRRILHGPFGHALVLMALASYGTSGLFGYGLHTLLQCEHCPPGAAAHVHGAGHSHADHCCEHSHAGHTHASHGDHATSSVAASCDDCSICSFLAQAQTPVADAVALEGVAPRCDAPETATPLVLAVVSETPQARGPPRA